MDRRAYYMASEITFAACAFRCRTRWARPERDRARAAPTGGSQRAEAARGGVTA